MPVYTDGFQYYSTDSDYDDDDLIDTRRQRRPSRPRAAHNRHSSHLDANHHLHTHGGGGSNRHRARSQGAGPIPQIHIHNDVGRETSNAGVPAGLHPNEAHRGRKSKRRSQEYTNSPGVVRVDDGSNTPPAPPPVVPAWRSRSRSDVVNMRSGSRSHEGSPYGRYDDPRIAELIRRAEEEEDRAREERAVEEYKRQQERDEQERKEFLEKYKADEEKKKKAEEERRAEHVRQWQREQEEKKKKAKEEEEEYERRRQKKIEEEQAKKEKAEKEYIERVSKDFAKFGLSENQIDYMINYEKRQKEKGALHAELARLREENYARSRMGLPPADPGPLSMQLARSHSGSGSSHHRHSKHRHSHSRELGLSRNNERFGLAPPVYPKIRRADLATDTLRYYDLPWEYDPDDAEYYIILKELTERDTDVLFEHTRRLRSRKTLTLTATEGNGGEKPEYAWVRRRSSAARSKSRNREGEGLDRKKSKSKSPRRERFAEGILGLR